MRCKDPKVKNYDLAILTRSFCLLGERRRVLQGIPLPGQMRPDLDPVKLAKLMRRGRARGLIDLPSAPVKPADFVDVEEEEARVKVQVLANEPGEATKEAKESLKAGEG